MSNKKNNSNSIGILLLLCTLFCVQISFAQEAAPTLGTKSTYHNQLFFNRFLINPTFSLVRENKSYINILHRNQYATFEDNDQNYFLGFSNKLNDRTALGISVYSQWSGVVQEFGFNANYATAVRLGDKNKLTFGTNLTYFTEGIDKNRIITADADNKIEESQKESQVAIQPGVTLSLGQFDFGLYATDLFKYNQTTNEFATNLGTKSVKASLQYTYEFMQNRGLLANARLMPLVQVGQNEDGRMNYIGSMLLDLPDYGWFQTNFDMEYGLSLGLGFNLSKKMSLGYLLERDVMNKETDLGWNHEVTLAYTLDREHNAKGLFAEGSEDEKVDRIVRNYEEQILALKEEVEKSKAAYVKNDAPTQLTDRDVMDAMANMNDEEASSLVYENRLILDELILRQDSIDEARTAAFEAKMKSLDVLREELKQNMNSEPETEDASPVTNTALAVNEVIKKPTSQTTKSIDVMETVDEATAANDMAVAKFETGAAKNTDDLVAENIIHESVDAFFNSGAISDVPKKVELMFESETLPVITKSSNTAAIKDYVELPIKRMNQADIVGVQSGFYMIVNVYKNKKYLDAFMETLKQKGLNARKFYNKKNGLNYVYLADFNFKEDAQLAYVSNLDGKYNAEKWIMQIDDHSAIVENMISSK